MLLGKSGRAFAAPEFRLIVVLPTDTDLQSCQSFQKFLNRSGAISVYRTVCWMFLWPR